jgi:hypothetical protein
MLVAMGLAAGCGGGGGPTDTGTGDSGGGDATGGDAPADVPHDMGPDVAMHTLFGPCAMQHDCVASAGAMSMCNTAFPGGICTAHCTTDRNCNGGHCVMGTCFPACTDGGQECDTVGGVCISIDGVMPPSVCIPSCWPTGTMPPSPSIPSCPATMACQVYNGACGGPMPTGTAHNGDPCTMDSDCLGGRCITETDAMTGDPSGFIGGMCISFGYRLPGSSYNLGQPVPQGNCPMGSGPVPFRNNMAGGSTACFPICVHNSDCRTGYACQPLGMPPMTTSNGFCFPVDCSMAGMACPSGYACQTVTQGTNTFHVCASSGPSDAGTDSGHDAGTDTGILPDVIPDVSVDVPSLG